MAPGGASVGRFVNAVAVGYVEPDLGLPSAGIDHVGVRGGDGERADRGRPEKAIADAAPIDPAINGLPHAPAQAPKSNTPRSSGSPATATTWPPRGGPMHRHLRASRFVAAPESCAMKRPLVPVLPRHSNRGYRVCHLAEPVQSSPVVIRPSSEPSLAASSVTRGMITRRACHGTRSGANASPREWQHGWSFNRSCQRCLTPDAMAGHIRRVCFRPAQC